MEKNRLTFQNMDLVLRGLIKNQSSIFLLLECFPKHLESHGRVQMVIVGNKWSIDSVDVFLDCLDVSVDCLDVVIRTMQCV